MNIKESFFEFGFKEFMDLINPWHREEVMSKADSYMKEDTDFSWIIEKDKDKIDSSVSSVKYGIPSQIIGNPDYATLFVCLLNPRTKIKHNNKEDIIMYKESENESFSNRYEYFDYIIQKDNILSQEINRMFDDNVEFKDVLLKDMKSYYYFKTYYYPIFNDKVGWKKNLSSLQQKKYTKEILDNKLNKLKICNFDLFPYRSNGRDAIKFKNKYNFEHLTTTKFVSLLVLKRIYEHRKNSSTEELIFIFRSYDLWFRSISYWNKELQIDLKNIEDYFYKYSSDRNGSISQNNIIKVSTQQKVSRSFYNENIRGKFNDILI